MSDRFIDKKEKKNDKIYILAT